MWFFLLSLSVFCSVPCSAGSLSGQGAFVLDTTGAQRNSFTNTESIAFQQKIFNGVASPNRIVFRFVVLGPSGAMVFQQAGNAVPGTVGNAAAEISGLPIQQFYSGPGTYTLKPTAELDGQTLSQPVSFTISSPNILLVYPPLGSRNLADNPLVFRWSASGASTYRVTVGDNPSFYNSVFSQTTSGPDNFLAYPQNPVDPRQRLTAGQVYYWKVEGLDPNGNVIAQTTQPGDFSVITTAIAKDLAVTDLSVIGSIDPSGSLQLHVAVKNQGNTTETGINLRVAVGGLPAANTPVVLNLFNPGESREFTLPASIPPDQTQTLATACLEIFDDNVPNNCKTLTVTKPAATTGAVSMNPSVLTPQQLWDMLVQLLQERGMDVSAYQPSGPLDPNQLASLIDGLRQGSVQVTVTGPTAGSPIAAPLAPTAPGPTTPEPATAAAPAAPSAQTPEEPAELPEWSGMARSRAKKAYTWVIRDEGTWEKAWKLLRGETPPTVDFRKYIVVGVAAGTADEFERIEIENVDSGSSGVKVSYRMAGEIMARLAGGRKPVRSQVPYIMRQVAASPGSEVEFERQEDNGGDR